jgi:hypothetical protein
METKDTSLLEGMVFAFPIGVVLWMSVLGWGKLIWRGLEWLGIWWQR